MIGLRVELRGDDLFCLDTGDDGASTRRPLTDANLDRLRDWARRYDTALNPRRPDPDALPPIGREMADFLDEGDAWLTRCLGGIGEIAFEVAVGGLPDDRGRALLDVPWELLAPNNLFLAGDRERLFRVERRLGRPTAPRPAAHRDLSLVFMAADVDGEGALNYEQEESAILQATQRLDLNLMVEESGALEFLGQTLAQENWPEALHLSCHGTIAGGTPVIILETPAGGGAPTSVGDLAEVLGDEGQQPALIFLSACRTAEHGAAASAFTQALIRAGVANALGWDGSVYDADAIAFAETFYAYLARACSVAHAAAQARRALLQKHLANRHQGLHWHLARVYLGPAGGGSLSAPGKPKRPFRKGAGHREFLDKANSRVPVASAAEFVGRRRQAQRILRAFRDREAAGVLVHGMGNLGKSSLAARVASRMPHHEAVVLFERYDALAVFDALLRALPPRLALQVRQDWRDVVMNDDRALAGALQEMLEGPFRCEDSETKARPILLIIDDLEQILANPQPGEAATPVLPAHTATLAAIITAFAEAETTDSRLLLTSRYTFTLGDGRGGDLADRLLPVPLPPMDSVQRDKQMHAATALAAKGKPAGGTVDPARLAVLAQRIKAAAGGNPGLQEILSRPLLGGEADAAEGAVAAVEGYLATGEVPAEASAAIEFFERVSLKTYRAMLTAPEAAQLRAATLFSLPVPRPALHAAGSALGVADPAVALGRLEGLGLVDLYVSADERVDALVNPLARPLVEPLDDGEATTLAKAATGPLYLAWKNDDGDLPSDSRSLEVARLALAGQVAAEIINSATGAGAWFLFVASLDARAALDLVEAAVEALGRQGAAADLHLLRCGADCAERLGQSETQERLLRQGLAQDGGDPRARAQLLATHASRLMRTGKLDLAETALGQALASFEDVGDERSQAVTIGYIADILQARGQLDEALRIRREEELPVYDRLGDVRSRAVTMGYIADILQARGQLDEALRIRREEELPVFDRLGDVRLRAVTMGKIADILRARGQLDEALRLLQEEVLPAMERLGDVRERAVTMGKIADILQARGQLDEALRIRREEELPVFDRLGDVRERAVTMGKIADVLASRGDLDKAIRTYRHEVLPAYAELGEARMLVVDRVFLASHLMRRDEAGDRAEAHQLLCLALGDAQRMQLPEAEQIEQILGAHGLSCD